MEDVIEYRVSNDEGERVETGVMVDNWSPVEAPEEASVETPRDKLWTIVRLLPDSDVAKLLADATYMDESNRKSRAMAIRHQSDLDAARRSQGSRDNSSQALGAMALGLAVGSFF